MDKTLKEIFSRGFRFEDNILRAFEARKLVFFIGAGVSRIMGVKGWGDFSAELIRKAYPNYQDYSVLLRDIPDSKERITIAYKKFEQDNKLDEFYRCFGDGLTPSKEIVDPEKNIYKILNRFEAFFLTTNADNLFEEVLGSALCHENFDIGLIKSEDQRRLNHLFYLHGHYTKDIDVRKNNLVFTAPQYVKRYNDEKFIDFLKAIFHGDNTIVFVGYGLAEFELIDYIITKTGGISQHDRNIYVLQGFCETDDIVFQAKKAYFDALHIELIPYDMGRRGYDSLIDVLKELYKDYHERTIVPVTDRINQCISNYNDENYAIILRYLRDPELAHENEPQITREIRKNHAYVWTKRLYKDGLFSALQFKEKIEYGAWPLLELFVEWVQSDDFDAQDAAIAFLRQITPEHIKNMRHNYSHIANGVLQIVFALRDNKINLDHLEIVREISEVRERLLFSLHSVPSFARVSKWNVQLLRILLKMLFYSDEGQLLTDHDTSYWGNEFLTKFNCTVECDQIAVFLFDFFMKVLDDTNQDAWGSILQIKDLDHVYHNHNQLWIMILTELNFAFSKMSHQEKCNCIESLLSDNNESKQKIGLYLARKFDIDIARYIMNPSFFDSYLVYHELYLLLKHHMGKNYFSDAAQEKMLDLISKAKFGIENHSFDEKESDRIDKLVLSLKLTLLQTLAIPKAVDEVYVLRNCQVNPYPTEKIADDCDYVHRSTWTNPVQLTKESFVDTEPEYWVEKLNSLCVSNDDWLSLSDCGRQFVQILLEQSEEFIKSVVPTLEDASPLLTETILNGFFSSREKITTSVRAVLIETCLVLLDSARSCNSTDIKMASTVFRLLSELFSDMSSTDVSTYDTILATIMPWMNISLDEENVKSKNHSINTLINYGNYDKFSALLNCYMARKKYASIVVTDEEINVLLNILDNSDCNHTLKYTLCFHYQNVRYCMENGSEKLFEKIFSEESFDITTLLLSVTQSEYVFEELIKVSKTFYLSGRYPIPEDSDRGLVERFYVYLMSAYYLKMLNYEDIEKAYADSAFMNQYLRSVSLWMKKTDFAFEQWLPRCWDYIKKHYDIVKIQNFAATLMHTIEDIITPTEDKLDLYLDVVSYCSPNEYIYLEHKGILPFFDVNAKKTVRLMRSIFECNTYIADESLQLIVRKYKEKNLEREACELLNMLATKGEISSAEKESIAKLLEDKAPKSDSPKSD